MKGRWWTALAPLLPGLADCLWETLRVNRLFLNINLLLTVNEGTGHTFKWRLSRYVFPTVEGKMRTQCGSRWGSGKYSKAGM